MHEFTVTQAIVSIVLEKAHEIRAKKITEISLRVGRLTGFIPESIRLQFALLSKGTPAEGACLSFFQPPAMIRCRKCNRDFSIDSSDLSCPECHTLEVDIVSGLELSVENMEIE